MQSDRLINALQQIKSDDTISVMLDGANYGEIEALVLKEGKWYVATAHEIRRTQVDRIINGKENNKKPERTSTKDN